MSSDHAIPDGLLSAVGVARQNSALRHSVHRSAAGGLLLAAPPPPRDEAAIATANRDGLAAIRR